MPPWTGKKTHYHYTRQLSIHCLFCWHHFHFLPLFCVALTVSSDLVAFHTLSFLLTSLSLSPYFLCGIVSSCSVAFHTLSLLLTSLSLSPSCLCGLCDPSSTSFCYCRTNQLVCSKPEDTAKRFLFTWACLTTRFHSACIYIYIPFKSIMLQCVCVSMCVCRCIQV